jgi:hypothetical protein
MKPGDRIKQLESELAREQALCAEHERLLTLQDAIIGTMLHKERTQSPDELRTLTFRERHGDLPPTTGIGTNAPLNTAHGLESFGSIMDRITKKRK